MKILWKVMNILWKVMEKESYGKLWNSEEYSNGIIWNNVNNMELQM